MPKSKKTNQSLTSTKHPELFTKISKAMNECYSFSVLLCAISKEHITIKYNGRLLIDNSVFDDNMFRLHEMISQVWEDFEILNGEYIHSPNNADSNEVAA